MTAPKSLSAKRIAIIGSGVSGLSAAFYIDKLTQAKVSVFEADSRAGGHVHTVGVETKQGALAIDTGFIVCNDRTYPNFLRLLDNLNTTYQDSEMSFSVRNDTHTGGFEYNGHNLNTLFAQRKNIANPKFWRFCQDILRFNDDVKLAAATDGAQTIGAYLNRAKAQGKGYGTLFTNNYLLPMISAIWSMGLDESKDFPLAFFVKFFSNHGLLSLTNRPQWYTITGGSNTYIKALLAQFGGQLHLSSPVQSVCRTQNGIELSYRNKKGNDLNAQFDEVIFACHGDTALKLLADATPTERSVLGKFTFTANTATLHTDTSLLPTRKRAWASWNYRIMKNNHHPSHNKPILTYNMNILQRLKTKKTFLVSLNQPIHDAHTIKTINYSHPVYNTDMMAAQARWGEISASEENGGRTHFCGAYWFNGFHEDGIRSGLRVCQSLGVPVTILHAQSSHAAGNI